MMLTKKILQHLEREIALHLHGCGGSANMGTIGTLPCVIEHRAVVSSAGGLQKFLKSNCQSSFQVVDNNLALLSPKTAKHVSSTAAMDTERILQHLEREIALHLHGCGGSANMGTIGALPCVIEHRAVVSSAGGLQKFVKSNCQSSFQVVDNNLALLSPKTAKHVSSTAAMDTERILQHLEREIALYLHGCGGSALMSVIGALPCVVEHRAVVSSVGGLQKFVKSKCQSSFRVVDTNLVLISTAKCVAIVQDTAVSGGGIGNERRLVAVSATKGSPKSSDLITRNRNDILQPEMMEECLRLADQLGTMLKDTNSERSPHRNDFDDGKSREENQGDEVSMELVCVNKAPDTREVQQVLRDTFIEAERKLSAPRTSCILIDESECDAISQWGCLGHQVSTNRVVFINTTEPFCAVAIGVQGAGKSHSVAAMLENCLLTHCEPIVRAPVPASALIFHYDTDQANFCESITLMAPSPDLPQSVRRNLPLVQRLVVLVSPSFYRQRASFYQDWPNCTVIPLMFRWKDMSASAIRTLMRVPIHGEPPLYLNVILDMLRKMQKKQEFPTFGSFRKYIDAYDLIPSQRQALAQRLDLIESLLAESEENKDLPERAALQDICGSGVMVVADLTDPMMTPSEARSIFEVLLYQFRGIEMTCGKVIVFDEAHKYLTADRDCELTSSIVEIVRQMRHHGMRVIISTQDPKTLPSHLLEMVSVALLHRFHSKEWFKCLSSKLPLSDEAYDRIMALPTGHALVFNNLWTGDAQLGRGVREVRIRARITADGGVSKTSSGTY